MANLNVTPQPAVVSSIPAGPPGLTPVRAPTTPPGLSQGGKSKFSTGFCVVLLLEVDLERDLGVERGFMKGIVIGYRATRVGSA